MIKHLIIAVLIVSGLCISCSRKSEHLESSTETTSEVEGWKEMDEFHMVMAETFHPYKDSSNLEPVKSHVTELVGAVKTWVDSPIPERVNNDEVKMKLNQLQAEAIVLETSVKTGPDTLIASSLTRLHNTFHQIQEHWYAQEEGDHEHH